MDNLPTHKIADVREVIDPCLFLLLAKGEGAHKIAGVREVIEAAGASLLYLPPLFARPHPIEQAFAKLKALLRKVAERSVAALWDRIGALLSAFTAPNAPTISATPAMLQSERNLV